MKEIIQLTARASCQAPDARYSKVWKYHLRNIFTDTYEKHEQKSTSSTKYRCSEMCAMCGSLIALACKEILADEMRCNTVSGKVSDIC